MRKTQNFFYQIYLFVFLVGCKITRDHFPLLNIGPHILLYRSCLHSGCWSKFILRRTWSFELGSIWSTHTLSFLLWIWAILFQSELNVSFSLGWFGGCFSVHFLCLGVTPSYAQGCFWLCAKEWPLAEICGLLRCQGSCQASASPWSICPPTFFTLLLPSFSP